MSQTQVETMREFNNGLNAKEQPDKTNRPWWIVQAEEAAKAKGKEFALRSKRHHK
jgi:hypothetical protein